MSPPFYFGRVSPHTPSDSVYAEEMKTITYKTHWSAGAGVKRKLPLSEFILDIFLIGADGVLPPFHVLNEFLQEGGNNGGMSPGTTWKPFTITESEYDELVETLLRLNVEDAKRTHPYINFMKIQVDESLHHHPTYYQWQAGIALKYQGVDIPSILKNLGIDWSN
jgi:hypothetical protein